MIVMFNSSEVTCLNVIFGCSSTLKRQMTVNKLKQFIMTTFDDRAAQQTITQSCGDARTSLSESIPKMHITNRYNSVSYVPPESKILKTKLMQNIVMKNVLLMLEVIVYLSIS